MLHTPLVVSQVEPVASWILSSTDNLQIPPKDTISMSVGLLETRCVNSTFTLLIDDIDLKVKQHA